MAVGGYDGMHLIYEALKKTNGDTDGDKLMAAIKGMAWESPRGPISIDPETRDIVQNIYIRKVEKKDGELYNVEFRDLRGGEGSRQNQKRAGQVRLRFAATIRAGRHAVPCESRTPIPRLSSDNPSADPAACG